MIRNRVREYERLRAENESLPPEPDMDMELGEFSPVGKLPFNFNQDISIPEPL